MSTDQALVRISAEADRIMSTEHAVRAILLAGSYARGTPWPGSDVDLLVVTETGATRQEAADVGWATFDTNYTPIDALEDQMARSFITCNSCLDLITLIGDPGIAPQIQATARSLYGHHVPTGTALAQLQAQVRASTYRLRVAQGHGDAIGQAVEGGGLVWQAGHLCLSLAGIGLVREDQWHDVLRTALVGFDAATPYARWHLGATLEERLDAALLLAEQALGESPARTPIVTESAPAAPGFGRREVPDAAEAVEMHRLIAAVGFGKMAKAEWLRDEVRQASEAGVICWFGAPALVALGGIDSTALTSLAAPAPPQRWWHAALCHASLPFDAAAIYAQALIGTSFLERKEAALTLGRQALRELESIFRDTPFAHKYRRAPDQP